MKESIYANYILDNTSHNTGIIFNQHCHLYYDIIFVIDGNVKIILENEEYVLSKNTAIIILPQKYHTIISTGSIYHRLVINFYKELIPTSIFDDFINKTNNSPILFCDSSVAVFHKILKTVKHNNLNLYNDLLNSYLTELFYTMVFENSTTSFASKALDKDDELVNSIISYINNNLDKNILLDDLANMNYLSKSTICHIFKTKMQVSIKQYIIQKKMIYAYELIMKGTPATEVALNCGYENYASFYKLYLKIIGNSPTESKRKIDYYS